jgi:hypothetical protein
MIYLQLNTNTKIENPMEILEGSPSYLSRVYMTPLKLNCNGGMVFLNLNENMAPRALQNER